MLEFLINPNWVLKFRSEFFTSFFSIFPLFATDYFYVACISIGYWSYYKRIWSALGFLVPCVTLINWILKYLFRVDRPDYVLHLLNVKDPFGFPSGDVMVAYIFWVRLFFEAKYIHQKIFCILFLICISASRIYLGVHSLFDVIGALFLGWLILDMWYKIDLLNPDLLQEKIYRFWLIPIYLGSVYILVAGPLAIHYEVIKLIGILFGYAMSVPFIKTNFYLEKPNSPFKVISAFVILILIIFLYPDFSFTNKWIDYIHIALKYGFVTFTIFGIVPHILKRSR